MVRPLWFCLLLLTTVFCQNCKPIGENDCGACADTYFFDGKCLPCDQAKDQYTCETCKGFYYRQGQCLSCSNLTNPGLCSQCRGFFFLEGKCQPCEIAPPYLCTLQCPDYFLRRGSCTFCGLATDELTCKFCPSPFQFKEGKCQQCPKHYVTSLIQFECMSCLGATSAVICSRCDEFYFANNTCSSCSSATDAKQCSLCPEFYFQGGLCKHCSEAGEKDCGLCKGFVKEGNFCVPCRLASNQNSCQSCQLYRFSTSRQMCVPCQQKEFFLNQQGTCQHCLTGKTQQACDFCPGYTFDKMNKVCIKCSDIVDPTKCNTCDNHFYDKEKSVCSSCANATLFNCILFCDAYFYSRPNCTRCEEAKSQSECNNCAQNYYWSSSGKCMLCHSSDFFIKEDKCVTCARAKNADECNYCSLYTFSSGKCRPCKYANTSLECSSCKSKGFYFSQNGTCNQCRMASQSNCNPLNCPKYGFFNGSCQAAFRIKSQAACVRFPYFSWTANKGCNYCQRINEYLNPVTESCIKCENMRSAINCSLCPTFYFDSQKQSCNSCATVTSSALCSKCRNHAFLSNDKCIPCANLTKRFDCDRCPNYLYRSGECLRCTQAISLDECRRCQNYSFENETCKRCEAITDMQNCQKYCVPQGYFPMRNQGLCLPCSTAQDEFSCSLCFNHIWDNEQQRCVNCSINQQTCQKCTGMYWIKDTCKPCPQNCKRCISDGKQCLECMTSYLIVANNSQCEKVCNAQFCHRCTYNSSDLCQECLPDYQFVASKNLCTINCLVARCLSCRSNSVCQTCQAGYTVQDDGLTCRCSIEFCDSCEAINSNATVTIRCNRCILGYSSNSSVSSCTKINCNISNCEICKNSTSCHACEVGWKLSLQKCLPICSINNCSLCSSTTTCQTCTDRFKLIQDKICQPLCNIENCLKCSSISTCLSCSDGFIVTDNSTKCKKGCITSYYDRNGNCEPCQGVISNCQACQMINLKNLSCKKCYMSYTNVSGQCVSCAFLSPNCINCLTINDYFLCLNCTIGFSLISGRCRKCADNCLSCKDQGEDDCDTCINGYTYNPVGASNMKCVPCLNNCMECQSFNITSCISCFPGSFIKDNMCLKCISNCKTCTELNQCTICNSGYQLAEGRCFQKRMSFCKKEIIVYSSNGRINECISCAEGYDLNNKECRPSNCSSNSTCTACPATQYLSSGRCLACPSIYKCAQCSPKDPTKCVNCMNSYYLQQANGQCYLCLAGCQSCTSKYDCKQAMQGYYLENTIKLPVKCPPQCTTCQKQKICSSCSANYTLYRYKCISIEALRINITVKPLIKDWDTQNEALKFKNLLARWNFYQEELMKLIGYDGKEELVNIDSVSVGSIIYNIIIDKAPAEDAEKVVFQLEKSLKKGSKTLQLISYKKEESKSKKTDESKSPLASQTQGINEASNTKTFIIIGVISALVVCILGFVALRRYLKHRIAATDNDNPEAKTEAASSNKLCAPHERNSDNSSDKESKVDQKIEQKTEQVE